MLCVKLEKAVRQCLQPALNKRARGASLTISVTADKIIEKGVLNTQRVFF